MDRLRAVSRLQFMTIQLASKHRLTTKVKPVLTARTYSTKLAVISADEWWSKQNRVKVYDGEMSYYDSDPDQKLPRTAVFLHGNPTSSYLWRHVMPQVEGVARCLAPDLIGMGRSSKIEGLMYSFEDHYRYLSKWFESIDLPDKFTIVCHDWGSGLGLHWANEHRNRIEALVYFEGLFGVSKSLDSFPAVAKDIFGALRSEAGEEMVLKKNMFVERLLPGSIIRELDPVEFEAYLEPFKEEGESRRPTLTWPREIPFHDTGPQNVVDIVQRYTQFLSSLESKDLPKLYIDGEPGFFSPFLKKATANWPNQKVTSVKGLHFLQEDSPVEIGNAVRDFISDLK